MMDFLDEQMPGIATGVAFVLVALALLGSFIGPRHAPENPGNNTTWFTKYGNLVCEQRGADLHALELNGNKYYLCQDKKTKVLSDFD